MYNFSNFVALLNITYGLCKRSRNLLLLHVYVYNKWECFFRVFKGLMNLEGKNYMPRFALYKYSASYKAANPTRRDLKCLKWLCVTLELL